MANINLTNAWTGSTIAPQASPAAPPTAVPGSNVPAAVTNAGFNLGQNQASQFYNNLLASMFGMGGGGGGGGGGAPRMDPTQGNAINFAIQQIGAENWNRQREQSLRNFYAPGPSIGFGQMSGISPQISPLGGGFIPAFNPFVEQSLSSARLAPSVGLGQAAAAFGSGGFSSPGIMGGAPRSGWTSPGWGF